MAYLKNFLITLLGNLCAAMCKVVSMNFKLTSAESTRSKRLIKRHNLITEIMLYRILEESMHGLLMLKT